MPGLILHPNGYSYHPTAEISPSAVIGVDTKIWHNTQVLSGAIIGKKCIIGHNCTVFGRARLGNGVTLEANVDVWDAIELEDSVFVGPSVVFTNDLTPRAFEKKSGVYVPTLVRLGASIGANATIVCGVTIGLFAAVAAGAMVHKDVPDFALMAGNPARRSRWTCMCSQWGQLEFGEAGVATCGHCGRNYKIVGDRVFCIIQP